ncbi:hypothetical protein [Kineothrix sedimenti]|uniref:Uncharacterized protein n=1 Tax=Kineothrix sedimenti TaxID=3123317 RepID=A0ABZ3F2Z2_9FIRM
MKIQIDSNNYITGWSIVGISNGSVDMDYLPEDEVIYYPAYQLLSKEIIKTITVNEPILKQREETFPIFDGGGIDTGETITEIVEYYEDNFIEKEVVEIEYYYQLDEHKKQQILYEIQNPPTPPPSLREKITSLETGLDEMANIIIIMSME